MLKPSVRICAMLAVFATTSFAQESEPPAAIAPDADQALHAMSDFLAALPTFAFTAHISFDAVEPGDEKILVFRQSEITVMRPGRIRAQSTGSDGWDKTVTYDGTNLIVLDHDAEVYSKTAVPDTIDKMLDFLFEKYGIAMPTADFLFSDVYKVLTDGVTSLRYLGTYEMHGQRCQHLAGRKEAVDYQLWIAADGQPLPVRMLVSYKQMPAMPQYQVFFADWRRPLVDPKAEDFAAQIPDGYEEVEMTAAPAAAQDEESESE